MTSRRKRDLMIFICGTLLGIVGNLFAEYWAAWHYPEGIPESQASGGTLLMGIFIVFLAILIGSYILED